MKINATEINALNKAAKIGGYDAEAQEQKTLRRKEQEEKLIANGGRIVTKVEPIEIASYKLRFFPNTSLWVNYYSEELYNVNVAQHRANAAYRNYKDHKNPANREAFDAAKEALNAAFFELEQVVKADAATSNPYILHQDEGKIRSNRRSLASDIAGVEYTSVDKFSIDNNIIMLHHDTYNIIPRSWMLAKESSDAEKRSENLCKNMIYALIRKGVVIESNYGTKKYDFWASTSSHQKVGIVYMGEHKMMERTKKIREFAASFEQLNAAGGDNGSEYIKRQAVLFTPSAPIYNPITNAPLTLNEVIMYDEIEVEREADNVASVDKNANVVVGKANITLTQFDGQAVSLYDWLKSCQMRGFSIKAFCVKGNAAMQFIHPNMERLDIDGEKPSLEGKGILMNKSCWKGSKLGYTWKEFVAMANELSKECKFVNMLRCVRWADSAADKSRTLSRQSIQQWITATDAEVDRIISGAVKELNLKKHLSGALLYEAALAKPESERTWQEKAIAAKPSLLCHEALQQALEEKWQNTKAERASGRIKITGQYPYIAMDTVAYLQIYLENRDPMDPDLGILKAGAINLPHAEEGEEFYGVRYPNNFLCGMIFTQMNHPAFADVGDVAILPYHGFAIYRADGDFDGDEMLFTKVKIVVNLMKTVIERINPPLVSFPHDKAQRHEVDEKKNAIEIAIALYNGQAFNKVGQYSNVAMKLFSQIAMAEDHPDFMSGFGKTIILAHVATILVIDMVKTGTMPAAIKKAVEEAGEQYKMPFSQKFVNHFETPYWEDQKCNQAGDCVADQIALRIDNRTGSYSFDSEGVEFNAEDLLVSVPEEYARKIVSKGILSQDIADKIKMVNYCAEDTPIIEAIQEGKRVSPKDLMIYFWRNFAAMSTTLAKTGSTQEDIKVVREEYYELIRETILNLGDGKNWISVPEEVRRRIVYNYFMKDAFEIGKRNTYFRGPNADRKNGYILFCVNVFSHEIVDFSAEA